MEQGGQRQVGKHSVGDRAEEAGLLLKSEELYSAIHVSDYKTIIVL